MSLLSENAQAPQPHAPSQPAADDVRGQVRSLLTGMYSEAGLANTRRHERFAYPRLIFVTPADEAGLPVPAGSFVVAGRHISEAGLGFFHPRPIPHREVIVSLDQADGTWKSFLLDLRWCRFIRPGWYESGGRLLRVAPAPPASAGWTLSPLVA